jgi:hypothetical protein
MTTFLAAAQNVRFWPARQSRHRDLTASCPLLTHVRHRRLKIAALQFEPLTPFCWPQIPAVIAA